MKKFFIFLIILIIIILLGNYFKIYFLNLLNTSRIDFLNNLDLNVKKINSNLETIIEEKNLPEPLFVYTPQSPKNFLTVSGILKWTNFYRVQNGLVSLKENPILDKIAALRVDDMFEKQYFAHYSKEGAGAPQIAEKLGYEYIAIGENIALGNFKDDEDLVNAWMESTKHKENILSFKYTEIGIAVKRSFFKDEKMSREEEVWIAVQVFGRPLSFCQKPDENLKSQIESFQYEVNILKIKASEIYTDLNKNQILKSREEIETYNQKIQEYNNLVNEINKKISQLKILISKYNLQVEIFNQCVKL